MVNQKYYKRKDDEGAFFDEFDNMMQEPPIRRSAKPDDEGHNLMFNTMKRKAFQTQDSVGSLEHPLITKTVINNMS
jgi:hypothetical protein